MAHGSPWSRRSLTGARDLAVGSVACVQTHGARAHGPPHRHRLVTDGGCRPDGTVGTWPVHDRARLTAAFRRAVLALFVRLELFDEHQAAGIRTWPHSGFHVHTAVWVPEDDRAFATRLARYCARNPVALQRLTYDRTTKAVTYRSDTSDGPTAGTETVDPTRVPGPGRNAHPPTRGTSRGDWPSGEVGGAVTAPCLSALVLAARGGSTNAAGNLEPDARMRTNVYRTVYKKGPCCIRMSLYRVASQQVTPSG